MERKNTAYFISNPGITITPNMYGESRLIAVDIAPQTTIMVDAVNHSRYFRLTDGGNNPVYSVKGSNYAIPVELERSTIYIYVRVGYTNTFGELEFSEVDRTESDTIRDDAQAVNIYIRIGVLSAPDSESGLRALTIDHGLLGCDKGVAASMEGMIERAKVFQDLMAEVKSLRNEVAELRGKVDGDK